MLHKEPSCYEMPKAKNSDCLQVSIGFMSLTGVWPPDTYSEPPRRFLYNFYTAFLQGFTFFAVILAEMGYIFIVLGSTEKTVDGAVLLMSHLVQAVKVTTIWSRQERIKRLLDIIDGPSFKRPGAVSAAIVRRTVKCLTVIGQVILASAGVTAMFWCIVPLLKTEVTLPLKTAYSFDISAMPIFTIMYVYNAVSVTIVGVGDAAENYLVAALMTLAGAQLDVLRHELETIKNRETLTKLEDRYNEVVSCVRYHQIIIEFVEELGSIFGFAIFCQFVTSSAVLCMTVFKITLSTEPIELITMVFYLSCVFMELLMYCYPGDLLLNKSLLVSDAAYYCDWVGSDVRTRRALVLIALRSQRALVLNAKGVFQVCLPTAAAVVQTSYSYYAMLKQKHSG